MKTAINLSLALALTLVALPSQAQAPQQGGYGGVTLQGGEPPTPKTPPPGIQYVTWPGFRSTEAGTEVFLQLTGPVSYKEKRKGRRLYVTLDKAQVYLKNNLRPIITRNFPNTPVTQFRLRRLKGDRLRLEITLRGKVPHTISAKSAGQYTYLVVAFPSQAG